MPLLSVPNVAAHPSTASVAIAVLLYNGPLLCGFNVLVKGLMFDTTNLTNRHQYHSDIFSCFGRSQMGHISPNNKDATPHNTV